MKRFVYITTILVLLLFSGVQGVFAANSLHSASKQIPDNIFTFGELGYTESVLLGPYDATRMIFSIPPTWQLQEGGKIVLRYSFAASEGSSAQPKLGGSISVYFNDVIIDTIFLDQPGQFSKDIIIPVSALQSVNDDGRHVITIFYDASVNCEDENYTSSLIIDDSSEVNFVYANISPAVDLSKFPQPIYQESALEQTQSYIVIPDQPSALELQAALSASAGLGALTFGNLQTELVTIGNLTDDKKFTGNLIFIGLPASFPVLQSANLPIPVSANGLSIPGSKPDDGVLQMALSPWNQTKVLFFVSGNTESGLLKAASILGSGQIVTSGRPDVAVVSDVNVTRISEATIPDIRTFSELGYENITLGDQGEQYASYSFYVSPTQAATTGAYIDLVSLRSDLISKEQSGITISLNGEVISSLKFAEDSVVSTTRINLLPNVIRRGNNLLEIFAEMKPQYACYSRDLRSNWVTLSDTSVINTPSDGKVNNLATSVNLQNFPEFLVTSDNLSNVAFVLPENDPFSWNQASRLAALLGESSNLVVSDLAVLFGNQISDDVVQARNIILVGQATTLPIDAEINKILPAPFDAGGNEAIQPAMLINYRLLPDISVGYIQLAGSPWNPDRVVLAVMGNTVSGVPMANEVLVNNELTSQLVGDFAIVYGDQIVTTDTRLGQTKESIVGQLPVAVTVTPDIPNSNASDQTTTQPTQQSPSGWILPALIVISVLAVVVLGIVIRNQLIERKINKSMSASNQETEE